MKNAERIDVRLSQNRCVSAKFYVEGVLVYRIPYTILKSRLVDLSIDNPFVVYILVGKDGSGADSVYVGKSTRGIDNRPASHEDKGCSWSQCYVITEKDDSFLNDGVIQYLEYQVWNRINAVGTFGNTTVVTNAGTANEMDRYSADKLLERAYLLLEVLGMDLSVDEGETLIDGISVISDSKPKTISDLKLNSDQFQWMSFIRDVLLDIDSRLRIVFNPGSWNYMRVSFFDKNKALVYCRAMKEGSIICYIQGDSDFFVDPDVTAASSNEVYGSCRGVFNVRRMDDAKKLVSLCRKSYDHQYSKI